MKTNCLTGRACKAWQDTKKGVSALMNVSVGGKCDCHMRVHSKKDNTDIFRWGISLKKDIPVWKILAAFLAVCTAIMTFSALLHSFGSKNKEEE